MDTILHRCRVYCGLMVVQLYNTEGGRYKNMYILLYTLSTTWLARFWAKFNQSNAPHFSRWASFSSACVLFPATWILWSRREWNLKVGHLTATRWFRYISTDFLLRTLTHTFWTRVILNNGAVQFLFSGCLPDSSDTTSDANNFFFLSTISQNVFFHQFYFQSWWLHQVRKTKLSTIFQVWRDENLEKKSL